MKKILCTCCSMMAALLLLVPISAHASSYEENQVLGWVGMLLTATGDEDARCTESAFGDMAADAVRTATQADVVILPGACFSGDLAIGELTWERLMEALSGDEALAGAWVTAEELWEILESGVYHITVNDAGEIDYTASAYDAFPQISGICFQYDGSAQAGQRVTEVTLEDGTMLEAEDTTQVYLVSTVSLLDGTYDLAARAYEALDITLAEAVAQYVEEMETIAYPDSNRIDIIGTAESALFTAMDSSEVLFLLIAIMLFLLATLFRGKPVRDRSRDIAELTARDGWKGNRKNRDDE